MSADLKGTYIFGSQITESNPKAENQIKTRVLLTESSVSEIKSPVSPSQRDRPSLFLDNQSAGPDLHGSELSSIVFCRHAVQTQWSNICPVCYRWLCAGQFIKQHDRAESSDVFYFFDAWHLIRELRLFFLLDGERRETQEGFGLIGSLLVRTWTWSRHRSACDLRPVAIYMVTMLRASQRIYSYLSRSAPGEVKVSL